MVTVNGTYSDKENGWVSEVLHPDGDIYLRCTLPKIGLLLVRQQKGLSNIETGLKNDSYESMGGPKIVQTKRSSEFRLRLTYQEGTTLQIFTTDTPTKIEYANI
jgi:hypothetical protein